MPHWLIIAFLFALGASVGSFLNVVVWRLPRITAPMGTSIFREAWITLRGLSTPASHCPKCNTPLSWRDNIPVFGWIFLAGKCRYCKLPISSRYPIVEFCTGLMFAMTYVLMFIYGFGPCAPAMTIINQYDVAMNVPGGLLLARDWWLLAIFLAMIASLIAASLIDAELYIIPLWIPWVRMLVGFAGHAMWDKPGIPGSLVQEPVAGMMAIGAGIGLIISLVLMNYGVIKRSFLDGEQLTKNEQDAIEAGKIKLEDLPVAAKEYTPAEVRREMRHEMLFLMPPLVLAGLLGVLAIKSPVVASIAQTVKTTPHLNGFVGSLMGAMIGAAWIWITRVLGSAGFGREAMGMGDVHLMFGVGAIIGAGMSSVAFFLSPLPALLIHLYLVFVDPKRAVPFGPYLSIASILVIFTYCPIAAKFGPPLAALGMMIRQSMGS
jgi:leader peptidase (prepilin peptidase)/N-methyltransferase